MENYLSKMNRNQTTLYSEPSHRLRERPPSSALGHADGLCEDYNSGLRSSSQKNGKPGLGNRKFKPSEPAAKQTSSPKRAERVSTRPPSQNGLSSRSRSQSLSKNAASSSKRALSSTIELSSDESEDELDMFSSQADDSATFQLPLSQKSSTGPTQPGASRRKETKDGFIDKSGRTHAYHEKFPPTNSFAALKFKKNKTVEGSSSSKQAPSTQQTRLPVSKKENDNIRPSSKPGSSKSGNENIADAIVVKYTSPLSGRSANSNRKHPSTTNVVPSSSLPRSSQSTTFAGDGARRVGPPGRPKPRPIGKAKDQIETSKLPVIDTGDKAPSSSQPRVEGTLSDILGSLDIVSNNHNGLGRSTSRRSRSRSNSTDRNRCSPRSATRKAAPPPFMGMSPVGSPVASSSAFTPPKAQAADFPMDLSSSTSRREEHPVEEDLQRKRTTRDRSRLAQTGPKPFPMSSSQPEDKDKGKGRANREVQEARGRTRAVGSEKGNKKVKKSVFTDPDSDDDNEEGPSIVVSRKPTKESTKGAEREKEKPKSKDKQKQSRAQAFPMSTQQLESIDSSPLSAESSGRGKRSSEGGSGDERISKKSKKELDALLQSPMGNFEDEGDSMILAPGVDPRTLCPFCDTPLPSNPSPLLVKVLIALRKKATRDPRPSNPLGLKAPMTVFVMACQRHRFESQILPEAEAKGWPKSIAWTEVAERVMRMKSALRALIEDQGDSSDYMDEEEDDGEEDEWEVPYSGNGKEKAEAKKRGAKARSIFWREVIEEVKLKGTRAVTGVRGQFANFEKAQPGYYGEQGSVIIIQTLYNMFPLSDVDPTHVAPLTANEFFQRILVPEVALRLIMEDKDLEGDSGRQKALIILRESSAFGVAMFPEDGGDWGGSKKKAADGEMGVGDMIVMERARKRRKELEEEEQREQDEMRIASELEKEREAEAKRESRRVKPRAKAKGKPSKESSVEVEVGPSTARPPRPKPRPVTKTSSNLDIPDSAKPTSSEGRRNNASRSRSRSVLTDIEMDSDTGVETGVEISESDRDSDVGYRPSSFEKRRSPSASERNSRPNNPSSRWSARSLVNGKMQPSSSQTDVSCRAVVNGASRATRSRSRSVAGGRSRTGYVSDKMVVDAEDSDGDEVEVVEALTETPVQKRTNVRQEDRDETPKASKPPSSSMAPLVRARMRKDPGPTSSRDPTTPRPPLPTRTKLKPQPCANDANDNSWLLSSPSQETA